MKEILVDVDGVVADLQGEWFARLHLDTGITIKPHEMAAWDYHLLWPADIQERYWRILDEADLYEFVRPLRGSGPEQVERLRSRGRVTFVTACSSPQMVAGKTDWLVRHGYTTSSRFADDVVITRRKDVVRGDVLIDDYYGNLYGFRGDKILIDAPYNRGPWPWVRAANIGDIMDRELV